MSQPALQLTFLVPAAAHAGVLAELTKGQSAPERISLAAMYLDTADRHLAREGLTWRLRREGRRWIQTLQRADGSLLAQQAHEAIRPDATPDASLHAGTQAGDQLLALLQQAAEDGQAPSARYRSELARTSRRVRSGGAVVNLSYDDGRLVAGAHSSRVRTLAFTLGGGDPKAMTALAQRWQKRFGLLLDPRRMGERGDWLAAGLAGVPVRKATRPAYPASADARQALGAVVDECLTQLLLNAFGLVEGDPAQRVDHVHQLRVGIRRLRSALRCFEGWAPMPPDDLQTELRALFSTLGQARDSDVLDSGVARSLARAGAPTLHFDPPGDSAEPAALVSAVATQRQLLQWLAWRASLDTTLPGAVHGDEAVRMPSQQAAAEGDAMPAVDMPGPAVSAPAEPSSPAADDKADGGPAEPLDALAARRLARWHKRIAADARQFASLPEPVVHDLRKRIKRQRYAVEFLAPVLRRKPLQQYLQVLAEAQEGMGQLNDLYVARDRYTEALQTQPEAWFALGWLSAKIEEVRTATAPALRRLAKCKPPSGRR
ncbi:CHAD domain-containing protein [uncultured Aquincola sp.]|mgnify:CR=1 FL=1|uniref:CYTH and CHAD domain-containing protein n=1 Tax=uncultured Aquincola sp. TaxID=886556 RepID=UPI0032B2E0D9|tara:strand:- start:122 stop:1756 length:1635 start_codon:yes stop_codon:yes gene_type:complete